MLHQSLWSNALREGGLESRMHFANSLSILRFHELLGVLPYLGGVSAERKPETNKI